MIDDLATVTAFLGDAQLASGSRQSVTRTLEDRYPADLGAVLVFDDRSGRLTDLDYWDAAQRTPAPAAGRPRLGVKAREVTLLPRHWDWLAAQPGGASAALRRLVEAASKGEPDTKQRRDAAYHFMSHVCGDRLGYEEALRALYRDDDAGFAASIAEWPADIRAHIVRLLQGG
ncbi:DUF2239 family protein [Sphingopyxis sp. PAMC25046]|uniref:DUF2239 family protein n=1 Tax=Sphingopyxis sp. PAMC25046 TaxID=2565556 RepID=UPI00109E3105|nr:DUF2239 family protein [Sphingopyxis sp. PAMC25046]QCB55345.1 DUF2239 family protein [Sphingopyxis sp. PAMC25046]